MRPGIVIVIEVAREYEVQMPFVEHDHMVQTLSACDDGVRDVSVYVIVVHTGHRDRLQRAPVGRREGQGQTFSLLGVRLYRTV